MAADKNNQAVPAAPKKRRGRPHPIKAIKNHAGIIGRVVIVLLALVICILPIPLVNSAIGYIPLLALIFILLISFVYLRIVASRLEYSEDSLLPSCERGSDIEFVIQFTNKTPLVMVRIEPVFYISDLFGGLDVTMPASLPLMPFEDRDFSFEARFDHIGTYSAGVEQIVVHDLLGLFYRTIKNPNRHTVEVLPRLFDVSRVDLTNVSSQQSNKSFQPLITDDLDYAGVRDYEPGDALKTVHWKLSARNLEGNYFTRLFETFSNPGLSIILDNEAPNYDKDTLMFAFDGIVESALSVNDYAHQQGIDSELVFADSAGDARSLRILDVRDFGDLAGELPRIGVGNGDTALELLRREANSIHGQDNVAFCSCNINETIISLLVDMKLHKRNPMLFLIVPRSMEDDELRTFTAPCKRLDASSITYYILTGAEQLKEVKQ